MDINSLRTKYESLQTEVLSKAQPLTKQDNESADIYPEKGDVYLQDFAVSLADGTSMLYSGNVKVDVNTGIIQRVDLEEKGTDGNKVRYQYTDSGNEKVILKKSETGKQKATVTPAPSEKFTVRYEEINFVESALNPEIEGRSEKVKKEVLDAAAMVELMDNSDQDSDKTPGTVVVNHAKSFSPGSEPKEFSGTVVRNKQGGFDKIELIEGSGQEQTEFYMTKGGDFDYFKKTSAEAAECTQIFDRADPKLVLFQEEVDFTIQPEEKK